ncbi:MAG TPA: hypothetical protein VFS08_03660 [Gemmatimonadaceae bacterium]|nr:hypothetical protein [Gemmatimonadaceae bacterium]
MREHRALHPSRSSASFVRRPIVRSGVAAALLALALPAAACHHAAQPGASGSALTGDPVCVGERILVVDNQVGENVDVYTSIDRRLVLLGSVGPGRSELALAKPEARVFHAYRVGTRTPIGSQSSSKRVVDRWTGGHVEFTVRCQPAAS